MSSTYTNIVMVARMRRELEILEKEPPPGISCWPKGDSLTELEAVIQGPEHTPYAKGLFKLNISIPMEYIFQFQCKQSYPQLFSEKILFGT
jgi:ubiquitin-protein ligase